MFQFHGLHCQCQLFIAIYYRFGVNFLLWHDEIKEPHKNRFTLADKIGGLYILVDQIMKKMTKALFVATCCRFKAHMLEKMFGNYPTPKSNAIVKEDEESKSIRFNYVAHAKPTEPTYTRWFVRIRGQKVTQGQSN